MNVNTACSCDLRIFKNKLCSIETYPSSSNAQPKKIKFIRPTNSIACWYYEFAVPLILGKIGFLLNIQFGFETPNLFFRRRWKITYMKLFSEQKIAVGVKKSAIAILNAGLGYLTGNENFCCLHCLLTRLSLCDLQFNNKLRSLPLTNFSFQYSIFFVFTKKMEQWNFIFCL